MAAIVSLRRHGPGGEAGVPEGGGDIQQEYVLHVPCRQEAVLRAGGEPCDLRARRGLEREGDGVGPGRARVQPLCPSRLHRWEVRRVSQCRHDTSSQWLPQENAQGSWCPLALE